MASPDLTSDPVPVKVEKRQIPFRRRLVYIAIIYLCFILILLAVELGTRLLLPHLASLDLFVVTAQQKAQVANSQQSGIFEGDPLLLWRLRPNLDHVVWDFTVVSTNAQSFRSEHPIGSKQLGTFRIVCLGDSVTFGYRVPAVWPEKPNDYDRTWLPYPMLLEQQLREANPGRNIEVITMAVPGYTSHQGLAWLRRDIQRLQPDLLTVSFGWNDVSFSDAPDGETVRTNWYIVGIRWLIDHSQAFAHTTNWLRTKEHSHELSVRTPVARVSEEEYLDNMLAISRLARQSGSATVIIAAPYRDQVTNPPEAAKMIQYRTALRSAMQQEQTSFLQIPELTEIAYPANEGWFGELIHPNHMGHRLIASELLQLFASKHLLGNLTVPSLTP